MEWIRDMVLYDGYVFSGIVGLGSATYYHRMSSAAPSPLHIFCECEKTIKCGYVVFYPAKQLNYDNVIHIKNGLYITTPKRTVCDMIDYRWDERIIYQSVEGYHLRYDVGELFRYAETRGLRDKLQFYFDTADEYERIVGDIG